MGTLTLAGLLEECSRRGVLLELNAGRVVCRTPREIVPDWLVNKLREHKAGLAELLADKPVMHAERLAEYDAAVERCNAAYRGTPIPFDELDAIASRILNAATRAELAAAVAEYEATAIPDHNAESLRQC